MSINQPDKNINLDLENITRLCNLLDNPQDKLKNIIHIAGTNGKGSTLFFIEELLREYNPSLKIARYISPHLQDITERFLINNQPIETNIFQTYNIQVNNICEKNNIQATYFERLTAIAFMYFAENNCDYCLLETGLGGRLDATNIITSPLLSIITNISYDHQEYLGETLELITQEKAGILKNNSTYITGVKTPKLLNIIDNIAQEKNIKTLKLQEYKLPENIKSYQQENLQLAASSLEYILPETNWQAYINKLKNYTWSGRHEEIIINSNKIILDGFHNIHAVQAIINTESHYNLLLAFTKGKDWKDILDYIFSKNTTNNYIFTTASTPELSVSLQEIQDYINTQNISSTNNIQYINSREEALREYIQQVNNTSINLIGGSLYFVGNVKGILEIIN